MISEEIVTQTWQRIAQISPQEVQRYMNQMSREQPAILAYLLTLDSDPFNRNEMGYIFFIAMVVWQAMKQSPQGLRSVPIEEVERANEANFAFLERFLSAGEMDFEAAVAKMLEEYPEPEVLRYIVEALMEEDEEEPFRDEYRGLAFICLKTVLDAFIASPAPTAAGEARSGARRHRPSSWRRRGS
ncbi:MAG: hypothetical protein N2556_06710 [Anaerolineae bacterium]|nr:hypothetical protein [Anaerolineae bacterium]